MTDSIQRSEGRRVFLKQTGALTGAAALASSFVPKVHAEGDDVIQVALVGCGGRGTGAAANALATKSGRTKLVAMADVFDHRLKASYAALNGRSPDQVDVADDKKFVSFDGYKKAMDCLRPGDVVILTTPPAFRWVQFTYAIEKGLNVFMEKPVTVDAPSTQKMLKLSELSKKKGLKVGVGLMCRHCNARGELFKRLQDGAIGDLMTLRAYRMAGPTGSAATGPPAEGESELLYQIRRFHAFLWASGGAVSDFLIHNIDECCWMKNDWPERVIATGGRHYRGDAVDQNFDHYNMEYTFKDGAKMYVGGRTIPGCFQRFATYVHGTKGSAIVSNAGHAPSRCKIFQGQNFVKEDEVWRFPDREPSPYQLEWDHLITAILEDKPHHEVERGAMASIVASMGRMAAHTGREVTLEEMMQHTHEFAPGVDKLTMDSDAPLQTR